MRSGRQRLVRAQYVSGRKPQYKYHLDHYGPQSRFGYKDLCAQWTLLNWEPDELIRATRRRAQRSSLRSPIIMTALMPGIRSISRGTRQPWPASRRHRYMGGCGSQTRAAIRRYGASGAQLVVVSALPWRRQIRPAGGYSLRWGSHQAEGKDQWWQGLDPQRLYGVKHPFDALPDTSYVKNFYDRTRDLIDQHNPDLLYFDNSLLPLGWGGMNIGAYFYNNNLKSHDGKMEAMLNIKECPIIWPKASSLITSAASPAESCSIPGNLKHASGTGITIVRFTTSPVNTVDICLRAM